jgi:hypothetical protein
MPVDDFHQECVVLSQGEGLVAFENSTHSFLLRVISSSMLGQLISWLVEMTAGSCETSYVHNRLPKA